MSQETASVETASVLGNTQKKPQENSYRIYIRNSYRIYSLPVPLGPFEGFPDGIDVEANND